jgi:hypothetical protein
MPNSDRWTKRTATAFAAANLVVLICIVLCYPAAGLNLFYFSHVRLYVLAGIIAASSMLLSIIAIRGRDRSARIRIIELLQMLQLIPAVSAIGVWPGGDDAGKIGWTGLVVPVVAIVALAGLFEFVISAFSKRSTVESRK